MPPLKTTLTQNCPATVLIPNLNGTMTVTGNVAPAPPAGSTVAVTFDGSGTPGTIDDRVVTVNATTDASGNWSASLQVVRGDQGTWSVSSSYAGNDQYAASQAAACSIVVAVSSPTK